MALRHHVQAACFCVLLAWANPGGSNAGGEEVGQDPPSGSLHPVPALHLDDALQLAAKSNWSVGDAESDVHAAEARTHSASARPNPYLAFATSKVHLAGGDGTIEGNSVWNRDYDSIAQLQQTVELGGKRGARMSSAGAGLDQAKALLADQHRNVRASVVHAYVDAAQADAVAGITRQSASFLRDEAHLANVRLAAGDISRSDRDQIEVAASRLELDAQAAEVDAQSKRAELGLLLGPTMANGVFTVADTLEALAGHVDSLNASASQLPAERADVAAARASLRAAEGDLALERATRIPDLTLFLSYEHQPPGHPDSFGFGLSLALPLWNLNHGPIAEAQASRQKAEHAVQRTETEASANFTTTRAVFEGALERWRDYRDHLRPRSAEIRETVSHAYQRGGASLLDLLEAQRNDNDVRLAAVHAAGDLADAWADLTVATEGYVPGSTP
jgi:cobalt-zinc-cadmium efflux system outer membrane protein